MVQQDQHSLFLFLLRLCRNLLILGILSFALLLAIGNGIIAYKSHRYQPIQNADAVIILGAHVGGEPLRPSYMLQYRLDKAIEYWQQNPQTTLITTGGKTPGIAQSEAQVMKNYLILNGIPESSILLEEDSTRTAHQFINSQQVLKNVGYRADSFVIITNHFHLPRAMMLANSSGLPNVSGWASATPLDSRSKITAYIREPLAMLYAWLFDYP